MGDHEKLYHVKGRMFKIKIDRTRCVKVLKIDPPVESDVTGELLAWGITFRRIDRMTSRPVITKFAITEEAMLAFQVAVEAHRRNS